MSRSHKNPLRRGAFLFFVALSVAFPQTQDERAVRAAYVFNITKLVAWPPERTRLVIGYFGDRETGEVLRKMLDGKSSMSKPISVTLLPTEAELQLCNILYFAGSQNTKLHATLARLENKDVLTIGEADSFALDGGMIGLVKVSQQIRMQVNMEAARLAGIEVNPRLLSLADVVRSAPASGRGERKLVRQRDPQYPTLAANMSLHGTVKLKVRIAPDGSVLQVECTGGHPLLAQSAIAAVENWKFESATKETTQLIDVDF